MKLAWVLFGLPLVPLVALALRRRRPSWVPLAIWVYATTAGILLVQVWPLLR